MSELARQERGEGAPDAEEPAAGCGGGSTGAGGTGAGGHGSSGAGIAAAAPTTSSDASAYLKALVRDIPDFPQPGIVFKDITPLMADARGLQLAVQVLADMAAQLGVDCVIAAEARGFLLGPALALRLGAGFVLARKPGKLPHRTVGAEYELEYGSNRLELHSDAIERGARVLVHDDLLATGGTARALCELVEAVGGHVAGCGFLIELAFLNGRERLAPYEAHSLLSYGG